MELYEEREEPSLLSNVLTDQIHRLECNRCKCLLLMKEEKLNGVFYS